MYFTEQFSRLVAMYFVENVRELDLQVAFSRAEVTQLVDGGSLSYDEGDKVTVICTASGSMPNATVQVETSKTTIALTPKSQLFINYLKMLFMKVTVDGKPIRAKCSASTELRKVGSNTVDVLKVGFHRNLTIFVT